MLGSNLFSQTLGFGSSSGLGQVDNSGLVPKESGIAGTDASKTSATPQGFLQSALQMTSESLAHGQEQFQEQVDNINQFAQNHPAEYAQIKDSLQRASELMLTGGDEPARQIYQNAFNFINSINNGNYREAAALLGETTPEFESYMNNMISKQGIDEANQYQARREDTALIRQADQLKDLGISSSGVLSIGGAGSGSAGAAQVDRSHNAQWQANRKFQQKQLLFRSILGMATSLAAAGIGGSALYSSRTAAAQIAHSAAGTARQMLRHVNRAGRYQKFVDGVAYTDSYDDVEPRSTPSRSALLNMLK